MMRAGRDLTGDTFGLLTVIGAANLVCWTCACECGENKVVTHKALIRGEITDCGCVRRAAAAKRIGTYRVERPVSEVRGPATLAAERDELRTIPKVAVATFNPQPKDEEYRNPKLLALANGQECVNCGSLAGVVSAHGNELHHGKGKSRKSHDVFIAWLCGACHSFLDQGGTGTDPTGLYQPTREDKALMWRDAADKTLLAMWRQGLIKVAK